MTEERKAQLEAAEAVRAKIASDMEGETPLQYMLRVMRDVGADEKRRDAMALGAAQYLHPKLAAVQHKGDQENPVALTVSNDATAFAGRVASLASRANQGTGTGEPN